MEALKIKKSIADFQTIPGSLNGIGDVYRDLFDPEKAIEYHKESLSLAREYHNKGAECDNLRDLGADYLLLGDLDTSLRYLTEVLDLARASGYAWYETRSCISLGEAYLRLDKVDQAKQYSDLALRSASGLEAKELIVEALWCKGAVMHRSANPEEGVRLMQEAITLAESIGQQSFLWQLYSDLGRLYGEMHRPDDMHRCLQQAKGIVRGVLGHFKDNTLLSQFTQTAKVQEVLNAD
jgi:tetratricopeptide (TPR) repeat protein